MFNNVALDVVIGLVFVYLLYSLLGTFIEEFIATNIGLRGWVLEKAIKRMLDDDERNFKRKQHDLTLQLDEINKLIADDHSPEECKNVWQEKVRLIHKAKEDLHKAHVYALCGSTGKKFSEVFYAHPLIKYLAADTLLLKNKPSYIEPETFAKVVIDLLRGKNMAAGSSDRQPIQNSLTNGLLAWDNNARIEHDTLIYLTSIWADAQGDVTKFDANLVQWFNQMMDRTTGWYKKYTQVILLVVGLFIAIGFNVDTIGIVKTLQNNPTIRDQVLAQANAFSKAHPTLDADLAANARLVAQVNSPKLDSLKQLHDKLYKQATELVGKDISSINDVLAIGWNGGICKNYKWFTPFGWILTALAISMGAPFWFDLLNKLMQLRSSVAPKDDAKTKSDPAVTPVKRVG